MATGDIRIDALVEAKNSTLAINHPLGRGAEITYSFTGFSAQQMSAVTLMLNQVSTLIGVKFTQVEDGGLLTYRFYIDGPKLADGSPSTGYMQMQSDGTGATVWLNSTVTLYQHILGRAPDQSGLDFWTAQLDSQELDKSNLLISFAESSENKIALTGLMEKGIEYVA